MIEELFGELKQYQFDRNLNRIIDHLDTSKYLEKDKESERYRLLRVVEAVIHHFKIWEKETKSTGFAESTYLGKFQVLLDILLEDADVTINDGETVSKSTQYMQLLGDEECDFGRRIDLLSKTNYDDFNIELCSIEFKAPNVGDNVLKYQQSKNIRINSCIVNNINNLTKDFNSALYMDCRGREGYMAQIFRYKNVMISQHVSSLYIPKQLIELDGFRHTLKQFYVWKNNMVKLSNTAKSAACKEQRRYIIADVSCSHCPLTTSPPRSPRQNLIKSFFTPTNVRTVEVIEK